MTNSLSEIVSQNIGEMERDQLGEKERYETNKQLFVSCILL